MNPNLDFYADEEASFVGLGDSVSNSFSRVLEELPAMQRGFTNDADYGLGPGQYGPRFYSMSSENQALQLQPRGSLTPIIRVASDFSRGFQNQPQDSSVYRSPSPVSSHSVMSDVAQNSSAHSRTGSAPLEFGDDVMPRRSLKRSDPPTNAKNQYVCDFSSECAHLIFDRKCEWSKHMDKHDRPYRCSHLSCSKLQGFTYSGGLLRHEREVHGKHGGPKPQLKCPYPDCIRHSGKGFTRKENLDEHIRRVHGDTNNRAVSTKVDPRLREYEASLSEIEDDDSEAYYKLLQRENEELKTNLQQSIYDSKAHNELVAKNMELQREQNTGHWEELQRQIRDLRKEVQQSRDESRSHDEHLQRRDKELLTAIQQLHDVSKANDSLIHRNMDLNTTVQQLRHDSKAHEEQAQLYSEELKFLREDLERILQLSQLKGDNLPASFVTSKAVVPDSTLRRAGDGTKAHIEYEAEKVVRPSEVRPNLPVETSSSSDVSVIDETNDQHGTVSEDIANTNRDGPSSVTDNSSDSSFRNSTMENLSVDRHEDRTGDDDSQSCMHNTTPRHSLQHAVGDLHRRIRDLFQRANPSERYAGDLRGPLLMRRHSLALPIVSGDSEQDTNDSISFQSLDTDKVSSDNLSTQYPSPTHDTASKDDSISDSGVDHRRLRISSGVTQTSRSGRSHSEPPPRQPGSYRREHTSENIRHCANGDTTHGFVDANLLTSSAGQQGISRKRKIDDTNEDNDGWREEGGGSGEKRRRTAGPDAVGVKDRFPCIFHVGEPQRYPKHIKKYPFISHLRRHLKSHDFHVCTKCFKKFGSSISCEAHKQNPCRKSCQSDKCWRYTPQDIELPSHCDCITSAEQQWTQLFLLQYPTREIPDIFQEVSVGTDLCNALDYEFDLNPSNGDNFLDTLFMPQFVNVDSPTFETALPNVPHIYSNNGCNATRRDLSLVNHVQLLRERVQLLEQRTSEPSEREQDLEMVLANVWQALLRSNSAEARRNSAIWRLMMRHARDIISTDPMPNQSQPQHVNMSSDYIASTTGSLDATCASLINCQDPSRDVRSDSGYHI